MSGEIDVKSVANAFSGTKLFVNSDIQDVTSFLQRYDGRGPVERIEGGNTHSLLTNPADFFKDCSHVPLADYMTHEPFLVEPYNRYEDFHYYTVKELTDDSQTISAFKTAFNVETDPVVDTGIMTHNGAYITAGRSSVKDSMSGMGDTVSTAESPHAKQPLSACEVNAETEVVPAPESGKCSTNKVRRRLTVTDDEE